MGLASAATAGAPTYDKLLRQAQEAYPKQAGKLEAHHIIPKYLGGDPKGPTVVIDAAYHEVLTQLIRERFPYGQGPFDPKLVQKVLDEVYSIWPLP